MKLSFYNFTFAITIQTLIWWRWSIVFAVWLTDERRLALIPAEASVRDPHYRESPTRCEQDFWTCTEAESRLWWMKFPSNDNHCHRFGTYGNLIQVVNFYFWCLTAVYIMLLFWSYSPTPSLLLPMLPLTKVSW